MHVRERDASNKLGKILRTGHKNIWSILTRMVHRKIAKKIKQLKKRLMIQLKISKIFLNWKGKTKKN